MNGCKGASAEAALLQQQASIQAQCTAAASMLACDTKRLPANLMFACTSASLLLHRGAGLKLAPCHIRLPFDCLVLSFLLCSCWWASPMMSAACVHATCPRYHVAAPATACSSLTFHVWMAWGPRSPPGRAAQRQSQTVTKRRGW
jgi:hypothetical protein